MAQGNSVGGVHVEGLGLTVGARARRWVPQMGNTHVTDQFAHSFLGEYVSRHTVTLTLVETAASATGDDTGGVLAPVLQVERAVEELRGDVGVGV